MTFTEAEQAIRTSVNSLTTPLFSQDRLVFPNHRDPDLTGHTKTPFLKVSINYTNASQMALGQLPPARYRGTLGLTYYASTNAGSKIFSQFIDLIISEYQSKNISGIIFNVPRPLDLVIGIGWAYKTVKVPFHFDTLT